MKASDITDRAMLAAVLHENRTNESWAAWTRVATDSFPAFPEKVVLAKARQLLKRRLLSGCGCGCRGDLELTATGAELLGDGPWEREPPPGPIRTETVQVGGRRVEVMVFSSIMKKESC